MSDAKKITYTKDITSIFWIGYFHDFLILESAKKGELKPGICFS